VTECALPSLEECLRKTQWMMVIWYFNLGMGKSPFIEYLEVHVERIVSSEEWWWWLLLEIW